MNIKHLNTIGDKVIVKKGEGGGGSEGGNYSYFLLSDLDILGPMAIVVTGMAYLAKAEVDGVMKINSMIALAKEDIIAVSIDLNVKLLEGDLVMNFAEICSTYGIDINSVPQITEEEFYTL